MHSSRLSLMAETPCLGPLSHRQLCLSSTAELMTGARGGYKPRPEHRGGEGEKILKNNWNIEAQRTDYQTKSD